ncbi:unnamed protein product [Lepidochelys kempii]
MLALGVIQLSSSPWASPVVFVPKKDRAIQFCLNYQRLNVITKFDAYPTPRPNELLDKIEEARYFTTMDLTKGCWQVPLDLDVRLKSAFIPSLWPYEFLFLIFGLKGTPATFQRLVDKLLKGMENFPLAYIDDIYVFSQSSIRSWSGERWDEVRFYSSCFVTYESYLSCTNTVFPSVLQCT